MDHIHTFLTTQGHGGPPRMSDQLNAGTTSETAQTWNTIHTKHTLSHPNKANMEWWWRRPNHIRGPWGPKVSWHLSYRWGKTPKKPHPGNLSRLGIEPAPAAWQARMLPLAPKRWTWCMIMMAKWYSGKHGGLKLPNICLTGEENPERTSPRKYAPTGDWTQTLCVTGGYATACPTAVDIFN